jgi:deoxyguanosine kinase
MKHKFIVIEGLSGSGKTAVSTRLAEVLNGTYYKAPTEPLSILREYVDKVMTSQTRALYYLMSISHLSDTIERDISKGHIIVDKYIYTTIAFNKVRNLDIEIPKFISLCKPDFLFYLEVDDKIREERLSNRNNTFYKRSQEKMDKDKKVADAFKQFDFISIPNNGPVEEAVGRILDILKSLEK